MASFIAFRRSSRREAELAPAVEFVPYSELATRAYARLREQQHEQQQPPTTMEIEPAAEVRAAAVEATPAVGLTAGAARAVAVARARSTARLLARTIAEIRPACREQLAPFLDDETPRYGGL